MVHAARRPHDVKALSSRCPCHCRRPSAPLMGYSPPLGRLPIAGGASPTAPVGFQVMPTKLDRTSFRSAPLVPLSRRALSSARPRRAGARVPRYRAALIVGHVCDHANPASNNRQLLILLLQRLSQTSVHPELACPSLRQRVRHRVAPDIAPRERGRIRLTKPSNLCVALVRGHPYHCKLECVSVNRLFQHGK